MIHSKYIYVIVIVAVIAILLFLYYFYTQMSTIKMSQQYVLERTLNLESDVTKIIDCNNSNPKIKRIDSPIMSISYDSDLIRGNESLKYTDITDNATRKIIDNIKKPKSSNTIKTNNTNNVNATSNVFDNKNNSDKLSSIKTSALLSEPSNKQKLTKKSVRAVNGSNNINRNINRNIKLVCSATTDNMQKSDDIFEVDSDTHVYPTRRVDKYFQEKNSRKRLCNDGSKANTIKSNSETKHKTDYKINSKPNSEINPKLNSEMNSEVVDFDLNKLVNGKKSDNETKEQQKYQTLLDGLTNIIKDEQSETYEEIELNHKVIKNISDTLKMTDDKDNTKKIK